MRPAAALALLLVLVALIVLPGATCEQDDQEDEVTPTPNLDDDDNDLPNPADDDDATDDDSATDDDTTLAPPCEGVTEPHRILYVTWDALPDQFRDYFIDALGDEVAAEEFYLRFAYWYGVAREAGRSARNYYRLAFSDYPLSTWDEETIAAESAIVYYRARMESYNLGRFHSGAVSMREAMSDPVPAGTEPRDYFDANEAAILADPERRLWFQIYWAIAAINNRPDDDWAVQLAATVCPNIDTSIPLGLVSPHSSFDDGLPARVLAAFGVDLSTWNLQLNPDLELVAHWTPGLVVFE